ncbi:MAG TPA: hypothetical protein VF623_11005 [Segetibacter sp.]|jgi:hypothetical protein
MPSPALGTDPYDVTYATTGGVCEYPRRIFFVYLLDIIVLD